jgi:hypothetical protein
MKLFTNGCSYTWGGGILEEEHNQCVSILNQPKHLTELREKSTWPWFLAEKLKAETCINYAIGCSSNDRIVRTTIDFFIDRKFTYDDLDDWLVIIQFTQPERYEIFEKENWLLIKSDVVIPEVSSDRYKHLQHRLLDDNENHITKIFNQCVLLGSFLKNNNIKHYFIHARFPYHNIKESSKEYLKNNVNWLTADLDNSYLLGFSDKKFNSGHLSTEGHEEAAEKIQSYIHV